MIQKVLSVGLAVCGGLQKQGAWGTNCLGFASTLLPHAQPHPMSQGTKARPRRAAPSCEAHLLPCKQPLVKGNSGPSCCSHLLQRHPLSLPISTECTVI